MLDTTITQIGNRIQPSSQTGPIPKLPSVIPRMLLRVSSTLFKSVNLKSVVNRTIKLNYRIKTDRSQSSTFSKKKRAMIVRADESTIRKVRSDAHFDLSKIKESTNQISTSTIDCKQRLSSRGAPLDSQRCIEFINENLPKLSGKSREHHDDETLCCVCFSASRDSVFMPCGHGGFCYECALSVYKQSVPSQCSICRKVDKYIITDYSAHHPGRSQ